MTKREHKYHTFNKALLAIKKVEIAAEVEERRGRVWMLKKDWEAMREIAKANHERVLGQLLWGPK